MPARKTRSIDAVMEQAKRQFSSRAHEDVSINDIATAAQCSTTTIYDVYANKLGLYRATIQKFVFGAWRVIESSEGLGGPLEMLINHLEARAERYTTLTLREMVRSLI
mgnify:FL=1